MSCFRVGLLVAPTAKGLIMAESQELRRVALDAIKWADPTAHETAADCINWCRDVAEAALEGDRNRLHRLVDRKPLPAA